MVDDQQVGGPDSPPCLKIKAILVPWAIAAQAVAVFALDRVPNAGKGPEIEIGPRAVAGPAGPQADLAELVELFLLLEGVHGARQGDIKPAQADVVGPSFDQHGRKLLGQHRAE